MQRVLIVAAVVLALVAGVLLWQRGGKTPEPARPSVAAAPAEPAPAPRPEPVKPPEPVEPVKPAPVEPPPAPVVAAPAPARPPAPTRPAAAVAPAPAPLAAPARPQPTPATPKAVAAAPKAVATAPAPAPAVAPAAPTPAPQAAPPAPLRTDLPGAVAGVLRDARGAPIAGTPVVALAADGQEAFETITGDDGFYLMAAMKPGRYVLFPGLGTPVGARVGARAVEIQHGLVQRQDLVEPASGATVRVRPLRADGLPAAAQAVLVRGRVDAPATLPALLAGEAILLPENGPDGSLHRRVPAGTYTLVILQGAGAPPRVVREPVTVQGEGELRLDVRVPGDLVAAWSPSAG